MSDDEQHDFDGLAGPLGELADERDAAWAQVSRGERGGEEVALERARAGDTPEQIELARALYRPHTSAERDAMFEALLGGPAQPLGSDPEPANDGRGYGWRWAGVLVALAAVAALLIWWGANGTPGPGIDGPRLAALPSYAIETDGGLRDVRDDAPTPAAEVLHYRADSEFRWTLRPSVDVEGAVEVRVFAYGDPGARTIATQGLVRTSSSGTVELAGRLSALELEPGPWTLVLAVGREGALPSEPTGALTAETNEQLSLARLQLVVESE